MSYRLPLWTSIAIFVQMVMGGVVVGEDAGFICPDWPLCHGQVLPPLKNPLVLLEIVHRTSAVAVVVLLLWTTYAVWRRTSSAWLKRLSLISFCSLGVQIVVGGMIVIFVLPGAITTIDVLNSMLLLGCYVAMAVIAYESTKTRDGGQLERRSALAGSAIRLLTSGAGAVLVGALFRHTGASQALYGQDSYLLSHQQHIAPSMGLSVTYMILHIVTGVGVLVAAVWFLVEARRQQALVRMAMGILGVVIVQMLLGMTSLATALALIPSTLHFAVAGLYMGLASSVVVATQAATHAVRAADLENGTIYSRHQTKTVQ